MLLWNPKLGCPRYLPILPGGERGEQSSEEKAGIGCWGGHGGGVLREEYMVCVGGMTCVVGEGRYGWCGQGKVVL